MQPSDRFQQIIDHVKQAENIEAGKRRYICAALDYFKNQLLTDLDRRDNERKLKEAWVEFDRIMSGSVVLAPFKKNVTQWRLLEESVGVFRKDFIVDVQHEKPSPRILKADEFFLELSFVVKHGVIEGPEKMLLLFGLWYLCLEARAAKVYRDQERIKLVYKYLHPRLKNKGFLKKYEGDTQLASAIKYFVTGSIY